MHRDIKPENFMIDSDHHVTIIDFGLSTPILNRMTSRVGSAMFIAPEVLHQNYDEKCDLWSAGCILFVMLSGHPPFAGESPHEVIRNILKGQIVWIDTIWSKVSPDAKDFCSRMLVIKEYRSQAKFYLQNSWMKKYDD